MPRIPEPEIERLNRTLRLPRTQMPATIEFLLNRECAYWVQAGFNARSSKALA